VKFAYPQPSFSCEGDISGQGRRIPIYYALKTRLSVRDLSQSQIEFPTIDVEKDALSVGVPALDYVSRFTEGDLGGIIISGVQVPYAPILPK